MGINNERNCQKLFYIMSLSVYEFNDIAKKTHI